MKWLRQIRRQLAVLIHRERFERDLEEEMRAHLEMQAEENRESGMQSEEALYAAWRQFGNATRLRESGWHAWGWAPPERVVQDLRFTLRSMRRSPGFALSVVLLLALAIWMNTTVFTVIHAVMLAPLPFDHSENLVRLHETNVSKGETSSNVTPANFVDWRAINQSFEEMVAMDPCGGYLGGAGEPEAVRGMRIASGFFSVLRVRPLTGRAFLPEEYVTTRPGQMILESVSVAMISHGLWQRRFGGNPAAIGSTLQIMLGDLGGYAKAVKIVGVMPPIFTSAFGSASSPMTQSDIWLPMALAENEAPSWRESIVIARRRPGVSNRQAQAEMDVIAKQLQAKRPDANAGWGVRVADLRESVPGGYRTSLFVLAGAVILVLLIACANVANLMLARGSARLREVATRTALGAGRVRLVLQLATESVLLSLAAAALGFILAAASVRAVVAFAPPDLPRIGDAKVNLEVFWFCLLIALATGALCGVVPGLRLSKFDLSAALKEGGTVSPGKGRGLLSRSLVVLEVAVSLVLLVGASLLARGFAKTQGLKLAFQADHVLIVDVQLNRQRYPNLESRMRYFQELPPRVRGIPEVTAAAVGLPPGSARSPSSYFREGSSQETKCVSDNVSGQYFPALGIRLVKGRFFTDSEEIGRAPVAIVNRKAARLMWPAEDAVGKRLLMPVVFFDSTSRKKGEKRLPLAVVGVVEDVPNDGYQNAPQPQVYLPFGWKLPFPWDTLVIRTSGEAAAVIPAVKTLIQSQDNGATITRATTMEDRLAVLTAGLRFNTLLMTIFAALAFVLAASGVYSLMSYTVTLRTREMSIRMAMGADRADILRLIVRNGAVLVGIGVALGLAGALGAARFASSLLYQVQPRDPVSIIAATALLVAAALAACYIPGRRAASLDVVETLRQE